jgi:predicted MFS family arabinose efflux permease
MFAVGWGANQFSPMLLVYRDEIGLTATTRAALFGVYAAGLIPGLLWGGRASDRHGRRALVLPFVALSPVATLILILGRTEPALLTAGRLLAGVCSGVVFGTASAWVQEISAADSPGVAARRAAIALSAGFGAGPLAAALVAQWAPEPLIFPYLPHLLLAVVALVLLLPVTEPARAEASGRRPLIVSALRLPRFRWIALLLAPWVFGFASITAIVLPAAVGAEGAYALLVAGLANGLTLGVGALVQPMIKRLEDRHRMIGASIGLGLGATVALGGALAVRADSVTLLLFLSPLCGVAYGAALVSGLRESERLADPAEHAATISIYLAMTYIGFALPFLISLVEPALGTDGALLALAPVALVCAAALRTTGAGR